MYRSFIIRGATGHRVDVGFEVGQLADFGAYYPDAIGHVRHNIDRTSRKLFAATGADGLDAVFRELDGTVPASYLAYLAGVWERLIEEDSDPDLHPCPADALP